jgi:membrane protease YdiL (CAAX protease family)
MAQIYKNSEGKYYKLPENHPIVSLIYLLLLVFVGTLIFFLISLGIGTALYGPSIMQQIPDILAGNSPLQINFIKIFQMLSSIGTFIIPCYFLALIESKRTRYFNFSLPSPKRLLLLSIVVMLVSLPLLELSILVNLKMQLPDFLSGLETWMKEKELEMEKLTKLLIATTTYSGLALNLLMIAILPAIGEELLFRGALQNIFTRWVKSPHLGIWIAAILFSTIHVQFYGFLPRMLMGALFGYLYYWGKSIWLPILAHFANNAYATVFAFITLRQGKSIEEINEVSSSSWIIYVLSFIGTAIIIHYFWQIAQRKNNPILTE